MSYSCKEPSRIQEEGKKKKKNEREKNDNTAQEYSTAW